MDGQSKNQQTTSNDVSETQIGSSHHHTTHVNTNQTHPKKKGGFVITSVKDNVDGDESADDLDESHASYSDVSYSRTTDIDHDQESSASEDTLNLTVQDGGQPSSVVTGIPNPSSVMGIPQAAGHTPNLLDQSYRALNNQSLPQELPSDGSVNIDTTAVGQAGSTISQGGNRDVANFEKQSGTILPQAVPIVHPQQSAPSKITTAGKTPTMSSSAQSVPTNNATTVGSNASKPPTTSTAAPAKGGASRVYKVVKRESLQPVKRERARWTCCDYVDAQTPNLGFVAHSASDTRLSYHDQLHHHSSSGLPMSMSATSVPSSSSAYSLQHSESTSSIHRDGHPFAISTDDANKRQANIEDRLAGDTVSDQELLKNVMQSSGDLTASTEADDESASSRNVRIDNKIEAAMDLVKKHLMLAVRDEVDELKEKIVELQEDITKIKIENETLKGILTPEQFALVQPILNRPAKNLPFQKPAGQQTQPLFQPQQGILPIQPSSHDIPSQTQSTQQAHPSAGHQPLNQKQSLPLNPQHQHGFPISSQSMTNQRAPNIQIQNQVKPITVNPAIAKPPNPQLSHPQQQQSMPSTQQQMMHKQLHNQQSIPQQQQGQVTRQATYPQGQAVFQPVQQQQTPLTPQQLQALRQKAFQQVPAPQGQAQAGYQSPQVVMQQPQVQAPSFPQGQGFQQQANQPQPAVMPPSAQLQQNQNIYIQTTQANATRQLQSNQTIVIPRHHHQPSPSVVTSPTSSIPTAHTPALTTVHPQFQPTNVPSPSAAGHHNGLAEQRQPQS